MEQLSTCHWLSNPRKWRSLNLERRLLTMFLNGMGQPGLVVQLWDGSSVCPRPTPDMPTVSIDSRLGMWMFMLHPRIVLSPRARSLGIHISDPTRFRQVMEYAARHLSGEMQVINQLLAIRGRK